VCGALFGGVFGLAMILLRRRFRDNAAMFHAMANDLLLLAQGQMQQMTQHAEQRRSRWVRLPYGIPLCVGFLFYLWVVLIVLQN
ncbi:MAG: prepilin peptidase, partial [Gemmataceae bacterium]|nr:prepilin peptidase [Gemmataceae bacterium]